MAQFGIWSVVVVRLTGFNKYQDEVSASRALEPGRSLQGTLTMLVTPESGIKGLKCAQLDHTGARQSVRISSKLDPGHPRFQSGSTTVPSPSPMSPYWLHCGFNRIPNIRNKPRQLHVVVAAAPYDRVIQAPVPRWNQITVPGLPKPYCQNCDTGWRCGT